MAGDGKTLYIKRQLKQCPSSCTISVNEAFAPLGAIKKLRRLPSNEPKCAIFFNFTLLPPGGMSFPLLNLNNVSKSLSVLFKKMCTVIGKADAPCVLVVICLFIQYCDSKMCPFILR